jgi:endonuclease I
MRALSLLLLLPTHWSVAQPPPGYYAPTYGLSGPALRQALNSIIAPHTVLPNSAIWDAFAITDSREDGSVWDMYSDVPDGTPAYVYQFVIDQCGTYTGEGDCFNREHSFPQSWYGSSAPMSTDLFHLYPADAWVNQQRGNLAFGPVGSVNWTSTNGGKRGACDWPGCTGTVFEPIDAYKGDFARSFFYMLTRYLPQLPFWNSPMMEDGDFSPWAESVLLAWHEMDPVSDKELDRNNAVFALQGNRNPFIDQPGWAHAIWGPFASIDDRAGTAAAQLWYHEDILYLKAPPATKSRALHVQDVTGRMVLSTTMEGNTVGLGHQLPSGVYMATIHIEGLPLTTRFVR